MRKLVIFFTTLIFAVTSFSSANAQQSDVFDNTSSMGWDSFGAQYSLINTGIEILHIDSNLMGTALVESGIGYHLGGVSSIFDNPENSLWRAMAAILGTLGGSEDGTILTGDDADEFLRRLRAAADRGDITITTTTTEVEVVIPENSGTVRICLETIFGCITIREIPG